MAVTAGEVLGIWTQVAAIKNSDQLPLIKSNQDGTVTAVKITAELMRAYMNQGFEISVNNEGYLVIGGVVTEHRVAGITPQLRRGSFGIECSTDGGTTWTTIAQYSDFASENVQEQTTSPVSIYPNRLNLWTTAMAAITITSFVAGTAGTMSEYMMQFTVDGDNFSLALPSGAQWVNGETPEWEDGWTYQVSVINNLAISAGWEAAES